MRVLGGFKAAAPPLAADPAALAEMRTRLLGRRPVLLASSHPEDEALALSTWRALADRRLLIIAPRDPARGVDITARAAERGLTAGLRSSGAAPDRSDLDVWIADTVGEMGLWYRLCPVTLIGGTFGPTEGHNPWEPAALGSAVLHGPRTANFAADFAALQGAAAALQVGPDSLRDALTNDHSEMARRALALSAAARGALGPLARDLAALAGLA